MIRINLLGEQKDRSASYAVHAGILLVFSVLFLVSGSWAFSSLSLERSLIREDIASKENKRTRLKSQTAEVDRLEENQKLLIEKLEVIAKLKTRKQGPVRLLDDVAKAIPDRAWLHTISQKDDVLELSGVALDGQTVSDFMGRIRESKFISETDGVKIEMIMHEGSKLQSFTFPARLSELLTLKKVEEETAEASKPKKKKKGKE